ncbi:hypothetical protein ACI784_07280 [Geodermatophilus sp. SYSU D01186]
MTDLDAPPATVTPASLRIDEVMPHFDTNVVQHIVVNAGPRETYEALLDADLMDNPLTRLMVGVRDLPNVLRSRELTRRPGFRIRDTTAGEEGGWVSLREAPGVEFLVGLVGRFWQRDYGIVRLRPEEFAGFDRPGYAKTVAAFSLHPHGAGRTLLTYECRTVTTDATARRRFGAYWLLLRPFVRQLQRATLVAVKRQAEHARTPHPASAFAPLPADGDR